ncbi:hypothetical protein Bca52824_079784 [Brassica carinata]|uniref:Uncharacterized protein n=1 Tax=Brassica carinata TaxID=52824 RepID=A0A8X7TZB9_BRACI|nr:hypothetical protein Bca52824_079784 [Brassica carinata]
MVNSVLKITADLENLTNLQPSGGCDDPNFPYLFKVSSIFFTVYDLFSPLLECERCGEVTQKETCVTLNETFTPPGGRGTCHLVQKESGTKFDEIDLSSGEEFTEYNEKGECPVMVSNFRASFSVTK